MKSKRKTDNFNKFFNKKRNSAIKEEIRQEKKAVKKERKEAIERHFEEKRRLKFGEGAPESNPVAGYKRKGGPAGKTANSRPPAGNAARKPADYQPAGRNPVTANQAGKPAPFKAGSGKPAPFPRPAGKSAKARPHAGKPAFNSPAGKSSRPSSSPASPRQTISPAARKNSPASSYQPPEGRNKKSADMRTPSEVPKMPADTTNINPDLIPLNKYIAHGGICSRRDAAGLIKLGKVTVNGLPVTEPGTKVSPDDLVKFNGKKVTISRNFVYILLNKPKDYITTTDDPEGRKTVVDLVRHATAERVYPVGRLDRNTSGVLLLTNDGDLAQKLAHPKHEIKKIYHVTLDKALTKADFEKIAAGVTLEDGIAYVDVLAYADSKDKTQIGIEIHSGRNRIVRRIFEHLGYDVRGLDRVMYAGLTKKNVQRGNWRLLNEKEIRILKYLNSSTGKSQGSAFPDTPRSGPGDKISNNRAPHLPLKRKGK